MNKKNYYQKPTMIVIRIKDENLLQNSGGTEGGGQSRQQRSDWNEEER